MSLDPELVAILNDAQESWKDGMEGANPAPENGEYIGLLKRIAARQISPSGGGKTTLIVMTLTVLGNDAYDQYTFQHTFWASNPMSLGQLSTFVAAATGKPAPALIAQGFELLQAEQGSVAFQFTIGRTKSKKTGNEYVDLTAKRRVDLGDGQEIAESEGQVPPPASDADADVAA